MTYTIVHAGKEDCKEILTSLWQRNFSAVPDGRYQWIYEKNPSGSPTCFLLQTESDNTVVGAISLFPRTLFIDGQKISSFICGDFSVDKKHRTLGPAAKLVKAAIQKCESEGLCVLFGSPNRTSAPVMLRAGFEVLDDICEMTKVISSYPYLRRHIDNHAIAKIASSGLNFFLRLRPESLLMHKPKGRVVDIEDQLDGIDNDLVYSSHKNYALIGERNRQFLGWRFMASPYARHQVFTLETDDPTIPISYIVFSMNGKRAQIVDFYAHDKKAVKRVFMAFADYQRALRAEAISFRFAGDASFVECFRKMGYSLRSRDQKMVIYTSGGQNLVERIKNGHWYLTSADNDI